jgi:outer membrane protein TolC
VAEAQQQILDEVEQALADCRAVEEEVRSLELSAIRRRLAMTESAYARGEAGLLEVELARLEVTSAERRLAEVRGRVALAGLGLERAIGRWGPESATASGTEGQ